MTQQVTSANPPFVLISVTLEGETDVLYAGEALLDTGYDGSLTLPASVVGGRPPIDDWQIELADGSRIDVPFYYGTIEIIGLANVGVVISVMGSEAIVGRRVMDYFRVTFDHGREVTVEPRRRAEAGSAFRCDAARQPPSPGAPCVAAP